MKEQIKNLLIGVFILIASGLIVGMILFFEPTVGDSKQTVYVRFSNINQIGIGTRVLYAGRAVGEVEGISTIYKLRDEPTDELGRYYAYQLTLKIDSSVKIYNTDDIAIVTSGLLGEKSIAIIPVAPPRGVIPEVISPNVPIYANSVDQLETVFNELTILSKKVDTTITHFQNWFDQNSHHLTYAIQSFGEAMHQIDLVAESVNQEKLIAEVKAATTTFNQTLSDIHTIIADMKAQGTFANVSQMINNLNKTSFNISSITKDISQGKGTIGKLLTNDEFYLRVNAILSKADTLMNDVNHYGVLFHLNKQWQRSRTAQASLLNSLSTPQEFKSYFENQVDNINTSMARISMLIEKAKQIPETDKILQSPAFVSDFKELLREVDEMGNNLRLYNQQLSEALTSPCE